MKMIKNKTVALIISVFMAISALGFTGLANLNAFAAESDTGAIGIGSQNSANVTISDTNPATLTLEAVQPGQYYLVADVLTEVAWVDLYAEVTGVTYPVYLSYNSALDAYIGLVTINSAGDTIEFGTYLATEMSIDVYLTGLFMGDSTDNAIYGLQIAAGTPSTVELQGVQSDEYVFSAQLEDAGLLAEGSTLTLEVLAGNTVQTEKELTLNPNMYDAFTEKFPISSTSTAVRISTTNTDLLTLDLSFQPVVTVEDPLPTTEGESATLALYNSYSYYYTVPSDMATGYYVMSYKTDVTNAEIAITMKNDPNDLTGTIIENAEYPIKLTSGVTYYFDVFYTGIRQEEGSQPVTPPDSVEAYFMFDTWTKPTIALNTTVYVPVTVSGQVDIPISGTVGTKYNVGLVGVPFGVNNITIHYAGESYTVNDLNAFSATITYSEGKGTIYFTTDYPYDFTVGVALTYTTPEYDSSITLNDAKTITLRAKESLTYYIDPISAGYYAMVLSQNNGHVSVEVSSWYQPIISGNETTGVFGVYTYDSESTIVAIVFTNDADSTITFTATVSATGEATMTLGTAKAIELSSTVKTQTYYIESLPEGLYSVALSGATGVEVYASTSEAPIISGSATTGTFSVDYDDTTVSLKFVYSGSEEITVNATVTMVNNGYMELGVPKYVALSQEYKTKTYTLEGLTVNGQYSVALDNYFSGDVVVTVDGKEVVVRGQYFGSFTATATTAQVSFTYSGTAEQEFGFNAIINEYTELKLNTAQSITMTGSENVFVAVVSGLDAGTYVLDIDREVLAGLEVTANGEQVIGWGQTAGAFVVSGSSPVVLTFRYYGAERITVNATVHATLNFDDATQITVGAGQSVDYYVVANDGSYSIAIRGYAGNQLTVTSDGTVVVPEGAVVGSFTVVNGLAKLTFTNSGDAAITFSAYVYAA